MIEEKSMCIYEPLHDDYPTNDFCNKYCDCNGCPYFVQNAVRTKEKTE